MSELDPKALEAAARALHARYEEISHWVRTLKNAPRSLEDSGLRDIHMLDASAAVSAYLAATPSNELWIGEYMLRRGPTGIWIGRPGGEGGEFAAENLEHVLAEFYRENF